MNLSERLLVQSTGRAVVDWYREFADQRSVAPVVSQALRYVRPRFHLDFCWRHGESPRHALRGCAARRPGFDRRLTTVVRVGRFALERELGAQRVRYRQPAVSHRLFRYDWFDADIVRTSAIAAEVRFLVTPRWSCSAPMPCWPPLPSIVAGPPR